MELPYIDNERILRQDPFLSFVENLYRDVLEHESREVYEELRFEEA